jgi:carboxylesterase type B
VIHRWRLISIGRDDSLFRGAICESGGPGVSFFPTQLPGGYNSSLYQETYNHLVSNTSCNSTLDGTTSSLQCLRSLPIEELNAALNISTYGLTPFAPIIDNDFVATYPSVQLSRGDFVHVPLIIGSNTDEGTRFSTLGINNDTDWYTALNTTGVPFPPLLPLSVQNTDNATSAYNTSAISAANTVSVRYPDDPSVGIPSIYMFPPSSAPDNLTAILGTQFRRSSAYFGDLIVISPRRASNHAWSSFGIPNWSYRFDVLVNGFGNYEGSAHFAEVGFVFADTQGLGYRAGENPFDLSVLGNYTTFYERLFDDLATMMSSAWIRMIVDGDPNGSDGEGLGVPQGDSGSTNEALLWPKYGGNGGVGTNVVFTVYGNGSSVEADDYREDAMSWLAENALGVYGL